MRFCLVFLDMLLKSGKPTYVYYGHWTYQAWGYILACMTCNDMNALDEVEGIKGYLGEHQGITGFLLRNLEPDMASIDFLQCHLFILIS